MHAESRIQSLETRCETLNARIHDEMTHPAWNEDIVRDMKHKRVKILDEIHALKRADAH